jgi:hypothetical protein
LIIKEPEDRCSRLQKDLEEWCKGYIAESVHNLETLIELADKAMEVKKGSDGSVDFKMRLSKEDCFCLVVKLPAECAYLQSRLSDQSIDQALSACLIEQDITNRIMSYNSEPRETRGSEKERRSRAEYEERSRVIANLARKQVVRSLTAYIERADKVYEGIKKVVDALNRESWLGVLQ